ncbi:MAG: penicillin acylase family protein [Chitinophagaceae bacterium]
MRIIPFVISGLITLILIFTLNTKWGSIPPLGKFLSPQQGFWQNAEPTDHDFGEDLVFKNLQGKVNVYLDERLVPHIFADNDEDAYFVQGFLHAKFRLWQMEFQSFAAAGRLSEILGDKPDIIKYDRLQRRLGMVYGAENALKAAAEDPFTQKIYESYTQGVNAYIASLTVSNLPIEYKLLDYKPEKWNHLKIALFFKLMASDLAGQEYAKDIAFTNEKSVFSKEELNILYPQISDSSMPIIAKGTVFESPAITPLLPANIDSFYLEKDTVINPVKVPKPIDLKGSNNWAVNGSKTKSGAPILCNDPHLRLTLPSIWYEVQMQTPTMNIYGVGFPGAPGVIIGFNDSLAFGVTNAGQDVMDYYQVRFKDESQKEYWYNNQWKAALQKIEQIKVRGKSTIYDTVAYTVFGPVIYDRNFTTGDSNTTNALAVRWTAHDPSNEVMTLSKLNRAKNYADYTDAIKGFFCPAQNILFASKSGDIAITQQGKFPARWKEQGLYIMPGEDDTYAWQGYIPQQQNPHILNPPDGFIQSANQRAVDASYFAPRGIRIYEQLSRMQQITPQDMMKLQYDSYSSLAADAVPLFLKYIKSNELDKSEQDHLEEIKGWDFTYTANSKAATIFQTWMDSLRRVILSDEFSKLNSFIIVPEEQTLIEILLKDSVSHFIDNINTVEKEDINHQITAAFKLAVADLNNDPEKLVWWKHRNTCILHLLRESLRPFGRLGLQTDGWPTTLNAISKTHGPSWRMIVHLTETTEAYGIYPGGQSGNPGSKYYDAFIDTWATGKYYSLWMMKKEEAKDARIKWTMTFSNS